MLEFESVMRRISLGILVLIFAITGCSWFGSKKSSKRINPDDLVIKLEDKKILPESDLIKDGTIIDQLKMKHGGQVIVVPFSPGADIEANDEFDRMTLRLIRSIADEFSQKHSKFVFVTSENAGDADFILEGRVTELQKPSMMKGVMLKNNRTHVSIQGKLIDRETEKPIAVFNDAVQADNNKETLESLGSKIGTHIGRFITAGK